MFIIAELAWAHDGDLRKAIRIAESAARAGADALSVHVTSLPDYLVRHYGNPESVSAGKPTSGIYAYLEKINLPFEAVRELAHAVRASKLGLIVMPNDSPSLEFSGTLEPDAYVLSPACFAEESFVRALGRVAQPIILRIGGATLGEIECALGWLRESASTEFLLLHGFQTYPTRLEETNLRAIPVLGRVFNCPVGLADHLDGGDELALVVPSLAVAVGAATLEKHITWDRAEKGEDFESALDPEQFARFVRLVRSAEAALGMEAIAPISPDVLKYRQVVRKRIVAATDLPAGTMLEARHLAFKRSDEGVLASEWSNLLGRRLRVALRQDEALVVDLLE